MPTKPGDRSAHFPAIEKKHGQPVDHWLKQLQKLGDAKYAEQIAFLRDKHGFSQAHANAVVMYARGSTTTKKFDSPATFFRSLGGEREKTARAIFSALASTFPDLELVIAWNQPMLKLGKDYVFGLSAAKNHLLIAAVGGNAVDLLGPRVKSSGIADSAGNRLEVNKKTIKIPVDWKVDKRLLTDLVTARLAELG